MKGLGSADLVEIVEDFKGDTFRAVYTVRFQEKIYVLHCFQKKATQGIRTPKPDMDKIHERLKWAERHAKGVIE
ncbi:type II toxin-antitoxin system RelE/ParE family toxin [Acidithiobacillus sp.]|uniref:type II toxin-antitoxin system RelE/ParE family toxin n=1 Tax=Acidithiobacillus sp. TaxID=1872118 RepID=UPI00258A029B|nr:type II toxin-antitoxin system RelE/ParE family toxin [Acidithiobacillus sp.]MDD5375549.1 type II toxin-antitoxin system RelE/ParE family toxin [Acidithiobacillus sp.]